MKGSPEGFSSYSGEGGRKTDKQGMTTAVTVRALPVLHVQSEPERVAAALGVCHFLVVAGCAGCGGEALRGQPAWSEHDLRKMEKKMINRSMNEGE